MDDANEERLKQARQLIDQIAARGTCADFLDVQFYAKGHGYDWEMRQLFVSKPVRDDVNARCGEARKSPFLRGPEFQTESSTER
jgi:hypothetical protein